MNRSVPALVIGSGITPLGIIRSLGRERIRVYYSGFKRDFPCRSRWCRWLPNSLDPFSGVGPLTEFLRGLPFERLVLFPGCDSITRAMARLDPETSGRFPASLSTAENHDILTDKGRFAELLNRLGLPHPWTLLIKSIEDMENLPDENFHRVFLKPRRSQEFTARFGVKAFFLHSCRDAVRLYRRVRCAGLSAILQEYIPGPPDRHYFVDGFVDRTGRICARFVRQRLRMSPPDFGNSSYMVTVPPETIPQGIQDTDRLLFSIRYRGIFSVELKLDERDGRLKFLEINSRPWWYVEFASRCGVNVCKMAYDDALGHPVEPAEKYPIGKRCVYPFFDIESILRLKRQGRMTLREGFKSWRGAHQPEFSRDDPWPFVWRYLELAKEFFSLH